MEPERIGRFVVGGLLGRGGMGTVYAGHDPATGEDVALKVLSGDLAEDPERLRRFEQEVSALSRIEHPGIVNLLSAIERDGNRIYFAMERLSGETLAIRLKRDGPLPVPSALRIARGLLDALAAAHSAGVVHRDVKPGNVVLTEERVVVTDFGLARMEDVTRLTQTGQLMGTLDYMSPEQCEGGEVDARTDLYAAGIVTYEMLTGSPPFHRETPGAVLKGHLTESPPRPDRIRSDLPPGLSEVVCRLIEKEPADRYPDAASAIEDLSRIADPANTVTFFPGKGPDSGAGPRRPPRRRRRHRPLLLAGAGAMLLVVAGLLAVPRSRHRPVYPGRRTVEATIATVQRAIRNRDYPTFSHCFGKGVLARFFGKNPAREFRRRAARVTDFEFRAEIPMRGAAEGEVSVRIVSGPALPTALDLSTARPIRLLLRSNRQGFRITGLHGVGGVPARTGHPPNQSERQMLFTRTETILRILAGRSPAAVRRLVTEGKMPRDRAEKLMARLGARPATDPLDFELLPGQSRFATGRATVVVRCSGIATALGFAGDRVEMVFSRSAKVPQWRFREVRAHE